VTDIQPPAAVTDTDQTAERDTQETEHPLITDHQETRTIIDQSQGQAIIPGAPETDQHQETDIQKDREDPTPETETTTEGNAAEHQTAKAREGHNHPTKVKQLYQG
jgi:hypothetical protein